MSRLQAWGVPGVAAAAFVAVWLSGANQAAFLALNRIGPATSELFWANATVLGDGAVAFAICLALWRRRPDLLWAAFFAIVLGTLWVHGLKPLLDLPRPPAVLGDAVHVIGRAYRAQSFPSGHATTAFAVGGLLFLGVQATALRAAILAVASAAALSRAVVGVHWPLDILAGAFGGWLAAVAAVHLARRTQAFGRRAAVQWLLALFFAACAAALVLGYPDDYPQALLLQRAIGLACLGAAAAAWWRDARLGHAGLGRRPDL
ncbi:MAG TPA: phosphatase PAP2 family protein [Burkholderiales bacterium]